MCCMVFGALDIVCCHIGYCNAAAVGAIAKDVYHGRNLAEVGRGWAAKSQHAGDAYDSLWRVQGNSAPGIQCIYMSMHICVTSGSE